MDKRDKERAVLRMVYDETSFASVAQQESPDFVIKYASVAEPFGVEVTEFYYTESDARVYNIPHYASDLLAGQKHRHRDDIDVLKVSKVRLFSTSDGVMGPEVPAIIRELPTVETYAETLATIIEKKDDKFKRYTLGLSHVNLIVLDREERLVRTSAEIIFANLFVPKLINVLSRTSFREVFFVTRVEDQRRIVLPLQTLLLMSELYVFGSFLRTIDQSHSVTIEQQLDRFINFSQERGIRVTKRISSDGEFLVCLGNAGVSLSVDSGVILHDFADFPLDFIGLRSSTIEVDFPPAYSLQQAYEEFRSKNTFISGIAWDALIDPVL